MPKLRIAKNSYDIVQWLSVTRMYCFYIRPINLLTYLLLRIPLSQWWTKVLGQFIQAFLYLMHI